eukprot:GHRR01013282.1.p1 GENE.GHRR01013282.1~~GHRR01013282.1.p1  ORF type:complete len:1481 (+),score=699.13 GHRR01013282.1:1396-5838(+)
MVRQGTSQSLVINGESGAGKTETTKKAMQFFAALAGGTGVEGQVLETNPILEAFGNAKTLRNHNSSRFGKLIEIHFNKTNHICGARIRTYLLEKSRVVHQLKGERSYHIFYQLIRGIQDKPQRQALKLPNKPTEFAYLSKSGCTDIDNVDDAANFREVLVALHEIGLSQADINALLATLSGILWLGNLRIDPVYADDSSRVKKDAALSNAASLLGLHEQQLTHAITHKKIKTRDELIVKPLTAQEAVEARDALAKALYAGVFNWVVAAINVKLEVGKRASGRFIAILDIYGFEQFTVNSFEQLCINYANERLQQQFTRHLFALEQEEYEVEGIDWTKVEWVDNQACVDVIEAMPPKGLGVLAVLDSQCKFPQSSDETFMHALRDSLAANDHFGTNLRKQDEFFITHYAGPVTYNAAGFLDKNKDMLNADLVELLASSSSNLVVSIGAATADEMEGKKSGQTVSSRFTGQLKELVSMLDTTGLHFVRCIKPNAPLSAGQFATDLVLQQLRCCGVLEVARVSRAGFPTRYRHAEFVVRYKILLPPLEQGMALKSAADAKAAVLKLLSVFKVAHGQFEMGRTKVFFKPGVLGYVEDTWAKMQASVLKLQAYTRMYFAKTAYLARKKATLVLQSSWRARGCRLAYAQALKQHRAAITIQRHYKGHVARQQYMKTHRAITVFQAAERRRQLNKRVAARVQARLAREAAAAAAAEERRRQEEGFAAIKARYGVTQLSEVQSAMACYAALKSELDSRDPSEVKEALTLLAAVRTAGGSAADLSSQQLQHALRLSAACQQQLGPSVDAQQLQQVLAVAAVCQQQLGTMNIQQLQHALAAAATCQQHLNGYTGLDLQAALQSAVVCKQELGTYDTQQLQQAFAASAVCQQVVGSQDVQQIQQLLTLAATARQQLGQNADQQQLRGVLQLGQVCQQAGIQQPAQLQQQLRLAAAAAGAVTPEQVSSALALQQTVQAAAGDVAAQQVAAALHLQSAAEDEGITDAASLSAALAAAGAAATAAAAAVAASNHAAANSSDTAVEPHDKADEEQQHSQLGSVAAAQGIHDPQELQSALSAYKFLKRDSQSVDVKHIRRACSMYAAAAELGIANKRDFMAAGQLYRVLCEDGITNADHLRLAVAMYNAVREECIEHPDDLHSAISLASAARDEGLQNPDELRTVLAASRSSVELCTTNSVEFAAAEQDGPVLANGNAAGAWSTDNRVGSLRDRAGARTGGTGDSSADAAALKQQVSSLQRQLEAEKAARVKYGKQLEQEAVQWMAQVKVLKEHIDSLRAKLPAHQAAAIGAVPNVQGPVQLPGSIGSSAQVAQLLHGLEDDWTAKAELFNDDATFMREVMTGEVLAPDMKIQAELDNLRSKYEAWNKQFKQQLREVQGALRKGPAAAAGGGLPVSPSLRACSSSGSAAGAAFVTAGSISSTDGTSIAGAVDVRRMPDLTAPDLLSGSDSGTPTGAQQLGLSGKKKKGLLGKLLRS